MWKVGLTGGIGAGKSWVAKVFETLKVPVYNADLEAKKLVIEDQELKENIIILLGQEAYTKDGAYNSRFIASKVFNDKNLLKELNSLIHPKVYAHLSQWFASKADHAYAIEEAALINKNSGLDKIIVVNSPMDLRLERIAKRDAHRTKEQILEIINKQKSDSEFAELADFMVNNNESELIIPQVLKIHSQLLNA